MRYKIPPIPGRASDYSAEPKMKLALVLAVAVALAAAKKGPKKEVSKNIVKPDPDDGKVKSPEYNSKLLEGDIVPSKAGSKEDRNGLKDENRLWPQGIVPYVIDGSVGSEMREKIKAAIQDYTDETCVRWVERSDEKDYVFIHSRSSGCYARLGRQGGQQELNLQNPTNMGGYTVGCHVKGIVIHEMLHTIGFAHEQSRGDRDEYIKINWSNIKDGMQSQFDKMEAGSENNMGFPYDYDSVMHYEADAFAKDTNDNVITTLDSSKQDRIGQRGGFSTQDIKEVNTLYKCSNGKSGIGGKNGCTDSYTIQPSCKEILATWPKPCSRSDVVHYCPLSCKKC